VLSIFVFVSIWETAVINRVFRKT